MTTRRTFLSFAGMALMPALPARTALAHGDEIHWPPITDTPSDQRYPGRWVWHELLTDDVTAAKRFYSTVFGWAFETIGKNARAYTLVRQDGHAIGGILARDGGGDAGRGGQWVGLMSVPDVGNVARFVQANSGRIIFGPKWLHGRGEIAVFADPDGAVFGVIRSDSGDGDDVTGDLHEWVWAELWARSAYRTSKFYTALAGYDADEVQHPDGSYAVHLVSGGYARAAVITSPRPTLASAWLRYVRVADVAATSRLIDSSGGKVVIAPAPGIRKGTVAIVVDPGNAPFAIVQIGAGEES